MNLRLQNSGSAKILIAELREKNGYKAFSVILILILMAMYTEITALVL